MRKRGTAIFSLRGWGVALRGWGAALRGDKKSSVNAVPKSRVASSLLRKGAWMRGMRLAGGINTSLYFLRRKNIFKP